MTRHCGREQHGLSAGGEHCDNSFNVREEAHVEHFVGFVHNEYPYAAQIEIATTGKVKYSPGGSHYNIDSGFEGIDLGLNCATAVHGQDANVEVLAGNFEIGCNLGCEFAGRTDNECLWC